ncbi:hypothetical protein [Bacillus sp. Hm123]|uniref:hypothetical protein n=1 Tax=Bacillus sp. Hm123 TaxID=3450745 RepID=UPI003F43652E
MKIVHTPNHLEAKNKHVERCIQFNETNVLNIQLKTNEFIPEHDFNGDVLVIVRKGKVLFDVEGQQVELTNENVLHIDPLEKHGLKALEDSDILVVKISS